MSLGLCTLALVVAMATGEAPESFSSGSIAEPTPSVADEPEAKNPPWAFGAFVDTAYIFNHNLPGDHQWAGQVTHPRTGEATLNVAAAYLRHEATEQQPWRFELAAHAGGAVDALNVGGPVPGAYSGPEVTKHVALANGGYRFDRGTEVHGGLMASPLRHGDFWSKDNWLYSSSLASNALPYYLMGVRVVQPIGSQVAAEAWVINGWQATADVNQAPSGLVGLRWTRGDTTVRGMVSFGPERPDPSADQWLVHGHTRVVWDGEPVAVAVVADGGREGFDRAGVDSAWVGGSVWVRGELWRGAQASLWLAGRPEVFWDRDGRMYGQRQVLLAGTIGPSLYIRDLAQVRLEYRYDRSLSSDGYFVRGYELERVADQHSVLLNLLAKFEHVFARRPPR